MIHDIQCSLPVFNYLTHLQKQVLRLIHNITVVADPVPVYLTIENPAVSFVVAID